MNLFRKYNEVVQPNTEAALSLCDTVQAGDWTTLEDRAVATSPDGKVLAIFGQDQWNLTGFEVGKLSNMFLRFDHPEIELPRLLINQLKSFTLILMYKDTNRMAMKSIQGSLTVLRNLAASIASKSRATFNGLDIELLSEISDRNFGWSIHNHNALMPLNQIIRCSEYLPFKVNFVNYLSYEKDFGVKRTRKTQTPVIPYRVYANALDHYTNELERWYPHIDKISETWSALLTWQHEQRNSILARFRRNEVSFYTVFQHTRNKSQYSDFVKAFEKENIPIHDYGENEDWMRVCEAHASALKSDSFIESCPPLVIDGKNYSISELKQFINDLNNQCVYLVLALTGMRSDELAHLNPNYGLQYLTINGEKIPLVHTGTNKITLSYKGKDDVFVTTETGANAFRMLNAIHTPIRKCLPLTEQKWMFCSLTLTYWPRRRTEIGGFVNSLSKRDKSIWALTNGDYASLQLSDPDYNPPKNGIWKVTKHQLRRSLAFYLVGFELADYPQLKRQFSHYSMAMTMYYARNADSFRKMYTDLERERVRQKATKIAGIYQKIANGERLAGGKGKQLHREAMSKPIEQSFKNRKLTVAYWEKEIRDGSHFHAIAPNMYCTNRNCSMRMEIDLTECVDCEFDIIESASYAESTRQEAMRMLLLAEREGWLDPSLVSRDLLRIRSAEKIMDDLGIPFDRFVLPDSIENILISLNNEV